MGKAAIRECSYTRNTAWKEKSRRLRRKKGSQPRLAALGSPFQGKGLAWILPPSYGRRCPEGAEVGWGKAVFLYRQPSPRGEGWRYEGNLPPANLRASPHIYLRRSRHHNPEPRTLKSLVKQNPLTRAFSSCIITSVVVMNYVY